MTEAEVQEFWTSEPCGEGLIGGLRGRTRDEYEAFFTNYDKVRYSREKHILKCLGAVGFSGERVLEIGLGQGADSEQIIRRGAIWSGLDLTAESVERVTTRLKLRGLPYQEIKQGTALALPFATGAFDLVFSHGVLHHVPEIKVAQREIARVLRLGGRLVVMLYAKWSLNYLFSIAVLRRLGLLGLHFSNFPARGIYGDHLKNLRAVGPRNYLKLSNFIHRNTDGPRNPYSKVYDIATVEKDFPDFVIECSYKRVMHAPPFSVNWLPFEGSLGWHLWVHMRKRESADAK